jgi:hypothetical protein
VFDFGDLSILLLGTHSACVDQLVYFRRVHFASAAVSTVYFGPLRAGRLSLRNCAPLDF